MFCVYELFPQKIPPGMEFNHIVPHDGDMEDIDGNEEHPTSPDPPIWAEVPTLKYHLHHLYYFSPES